MKNLLPIAAIVLALGFAVGGFALADGNNPTNTPGSTPVSVTSQQSATTCITSAAAAAAQAIATVPAVSGQYFYVTWLDITYSAIAAPSATLMAATTTNFPGSFTVSQPMQAAVGDNQRQFNFGPGGLKSAAPGTATVVSGNAGVAAISQNIRICGFYAP